MSTHQTPPQPGHMPPPPPGHTPSSIPTPPQSRAGSGAQPPPAPPKGPTQHGTDPSTGIDANGIAAYGTLIQVLSDPGPPEVYTTIEGVGDITGPNTSLAELETTSHSTGAPVRTFIPGLIDPGDLTFPCFWNPSDATQSSTSPFGLEYLFWNRIRTKFQLVGTDPTHRTRQFVGFVKQISETYPVAGIATRATAIRITTPYKDVTPSINVIPDTVSIPNAGGPGVTPIEVNTGGSNTPWLPIPTVNWITITDPITPEVGDGAITYTVAAGTMGATRTGIISIAALSLQVTVTQEAA